MISKSLYNEKQKSNADKNVSISIKSNRNRNLNRNNLKNNKITDEITERIEKLKKESNINYLIENYNKSIELYTYAIELLPKLNKNNVEENKTITINLYNNRGNCQIKMRNYKVGIKDFTKVLNIDPNNIMLIIDNWYVSNEYAYSNTDAIANPKLNPVDNLSLNEITHKEAYTIADNIYLYDGKSILSNNINI